MIAIIVVGNNVYPQSFDYNKYLNQAKQKGRNLINEIQKELDRTDQFTKSQNKKDFYVLYNTDGKKMACFPDEFACRAKIRNIELRIHNYIDNFINGVPSSVSSREKKEISKQAKAQIVMTCYCRKESNPNYREQYTSNNFNSDRAYNFNQNHNPDNMSAPAPAYPSSQNVNIPTQYDNVLDALAAAAETDVAATAVTNTPPTTSIDFSEMEKHVSKSSNEIYVDNTNWKGPISQPPIYLGDRNNYRTANLPPKQDPNTTYFVLPQEKEKGIQLAKDLLPKAEEKLANFDQDMGNLNKQYDETGQNYSRLINDKEKQLAIDEYKLGIAEYGDDETKHSVTKNDLKYKFGLTEEEILIAREDVIKKVEEADWRKIGSFKSDNEVFNGETLDGAVTRDVVIPMSRFLDILNGSEVKHADIRNEMRLSDLKDEYKKTKEKTQQELNNLVQTKENSLNEISILQQKLITEKEDISKVKNYYDNVIQNGKVVFNSNNSIDAMNLGNILNDILNK